MRVLLASVSGESDGFRLMTMVILSLAFLADLGLDIDVESKRKFPASG